MVHTAVEWPWSSYRATVGVDSPLAGVYVDWILAAFGDDRGKAIDEYNGFVANGKGLPSPWQELKNQIYMGSEQFVAEMQQACSCDPGFPDARQTNKEGPCWGLLYWA